MSQVNVTWVEKCLKIFYFYIIIILFISHENKNLSLLSTSVGETKRCDKFCVVLNQS